jgi:hypothetical protein
VSDETSVAVVTALVKFEFAAADTISASNRNDEFMPAFQSRIENGEHVCKELSLV